MKEYTTEFLRNIALVAHGGAGKTMMTEAFLHFTGATTRLGKVEEGTTASDYEEDEIRRKISLSISVIPVEYHDHKINLLDAPGYTDFIGEVVSALSVADAAAIVVDAVSGIEVGTEAAWRFCNKFKLPRFVIINKMDRENANFDKAYESVDAHARAHEMRVVKFQLPWGEKLDFKGVIDLVSMKAYAGDGKTPQDIPAEYKDAVAEARMALIEAAAEGEDTLLEKYLETGELSQEELLRGLRDVVLSGAFIPVFVAAAGHEKGLAPLLNAFVDLFPSPAERPAVTAQGKDGDELLTAKDGNPLALYVWKTTADPFVGKVTYFKVISGMLNTDIHLWNPAKNAEERLAGLHLQRGKEQVAVKTVHAGDIATVSKLAVTVTGDSLCDKNHLLMVPAPEYPGALYQVAIHPKSQADAAKISPTLTRLCEEDMTLSWHNEPSTHQTILQGVGEQHIEVAIHRAQAKFQVGLLTAEPRVPYREGITRKASAQYRHKKQSGGSGQFGEVHLRIEPYHEADFLFADELVGMNLSKSYLPPIEKGIRAAMEQGVFAGYPLSNVKVIVYDGKEHPVDSKPIAFETAGREAFKLAVHDAGPVLFEPVMSVRVVVPDAHMGDVMGDMNTRRGRVQGTESERGLTIINAHVPLAEMLKYTTQLRSMTGGRGYFSMDFDHYDVVPAQLAQPIMEAHKKEMEAKKEE
ncbi:MAG: elongation factor G [Anaerolineae bacterium CG_4_9_14_3_um_filter_57_17]|nr:elongation factor G [bacterium]NCT20001.1 elongation factor G [bacterium]OIO87196.1 MAG: elongation factor G [Anaerolineae bacterium CG2_30_57_67]PJB67113.1 MAG: elongation factor G [Anaerolineae bacterium CG_4_9_14_3_um_filter_57_17]